MSDTGQEIRVIAEIKSRPGQEASLREVLQACVAPTRAEAGNRSYTLHEDLQSAGHYFFYETWISRDALDQHFQTPHFKTLVEKIKPLTAQPPSIAVLRALG
jgi:quinol monooxygenase YgiN